MADTTRAFGLAGLLALLAGWMLLVPSPLVHAGRAGTVASCVTVEGPLPGGLPGDRSAGEIAETYPFFATTDDLAGGGYVEEEYLISGTATGFSTSGAVVAEDVPFRTRVIVRRPRDASAFNGTVLAEWQNVTAGYDLDVLWDGEHVMRSGYAWVGISAQRVGVDFLRSWSPARYGSLDVTGGGRYGEDVLSYHIYHQAALALRSGEHRCPGSADPMGGLVVERLLGVGASQSAGRMRTYYDLVLPLLGERAFAGFAFVVGPAPTREGEEPVFHILSETDVRSPTRRPDSDRYRRWEVAGAAHYGYHAAVYVRALAERDLPSGAPQYECANPPFSRVPLHHVLRASYDHLARWAAGGAAPPLAPKLEFDAQGRLARDALGLALGGIRLAAVQAPTALNTGVNSGQSFCFLFGTHIPFDDAALARLYGSKEAYVEAVRRASLANLAAGYIVEADALATIREAEESDIGERIERGQRAAAAPTPPRTGSGSERLPLGRGARWGLVASLALLALGAGFLAVAGARRPGRR